MSDATSPAPSGWYPDPAGERQWRVWTGTQWSSATRPYDTGDAEESREPRLGIDELAAIAALQRLARVGVLAYYAGFALLVGLATHWPGRVHPVSVRFASVMTGVGVGLTLIGALTFAAGVRALRGRWTLDALIPVVNTFSAAYWMSRRLGAPKVEFRFYADILITVGFILLCGTQPWVGVALAGVAVTQLARVYVVMDQLSGPPRVGADAS